MKRFFCVVYCQYYLLGLDLWWIRIWFCFLTIVNRWKKRCFSVLWFHFDRRQADSNAEQIKTNCNQFQHMSVLLKLPCTSLKTSWITLSQQLTAKHCKVNLNKNLCFSKERPGRKERPHIFPQAKYNITLLRRQNCLAHPLNIWVATCTGFYWGFFQSQRDRLTESDPSRDGLTGKTVKACCIIQTHWQKLTQGQGCPRNHWDGRTNLHCVCYFCTYTYRHIQTREVITRFYTRRHCDYLIEYDFFKITVTIPERRNTNSKPDTIIITRLTIFFFMIVTINTLLS